MRRITALMVLFSFLLITPMAMADDQKKSNAAKPKEEVVKLDADEIFALVEQALKGPEADRAAVRAFLQNALDGKVTMTRLDVAIDEGMSKCLTKACGDKGCKKCNLNTNKCFCSNCCIAVTQ